MILGVHLTKDHFGRASGQAYCELKTSKDVELAMKKDKEYIKNRYIEIFESTSTDLAKALSRPHQYSKRGQITVVVMVVITIKGEAGKVVIRVVQEVDIPVVE
eukprot:UN27173